MKTQYKAYFDGKVLVQGSQQKCIDFARTTEAYLAGTTLVYGSGYLTSYQYTCGSLIVIARGEN